MSGHSWALHVAAYPGNSQATATPMQAAINVIDTAIEDGDSVALPPASGGQLCYVENRSGNAISVWSAPGTRDTIYSGTSASLMAPLIAGAMVMFVSTPGQWALASAPPSAPVTGPPGPQGPVGPPGPPAVSADAGNQAKLGTDSLLLVPRATGVTDGSNAAAGQVGEFLSVQLLSSALRPVVPSVDATVIALTLTPGDWDVWGSAGFTMSGCTGITLRAWLNAGGTTAPPVDQLGGNAVAGPANNTPQAILPLTPMRVSSASAIAVTLGVTPTFGGANPTCAAWGKILARRMR